MRGGAKIRVAVVDDSFFVRKAIQRMLSGDARMRVVGIAGTGEELLESFERWRPDVITLDLAMPGMGGLQTLDRIMELRPTPVIVLSSYARLFAPVAIEALHRGAVDFIDKQRYSLVDFSTLGELLVEKILTLAGVDPEAGAPTGAGSHRDGGSRWESAEAAERLPVPTGGPLATRASPFEIVLVGASTGGPVAIEQVLAGLGPESAPPVAVVQHMPEGFTRPFAERLNSQLPFSVREAVDGETLRAGDVRIGPVGWHLLVEPGSDGPRTLLVEEPAEVSHRPAVDQLFGSAAETMADSTLAVLLTGMGSDGARGMALLAAGGAYTLAQDQDSSVVYGMPRAAVELGAVREVLPLEEIGPRIAALVRLGGVRAAG